MPRLPAASTTTLHTCTNTNTVWNNLLLENHQEVFKTFKSIQNFLFKSLFLHREKTQKLPVCCYATTVMQPCNKYLQYHVVCSLYCMEYVWYIFFLTFWVLVFSPTFYILTVMHQNTQKNQNKNVFLVLGRQLTLISFICKWFSRQID